MEDWAMRLPRVRLSVEWVDIPLRFSIWHLLIMVAIAALAIGLGIAADRWKRRSDYCLYWARFHSHLEAGIRTQCIYGCPHMVDPKPSSAYHAHLRTLYEQAAWLPWQRLPDD